VILREEHRLRMFSNRALRSILGPKRDEETDGGTIRNFVIGTHR
jgi:hypothetical protein